MRLRTHILSFLFLFAFTPLFLAFIINLPLVLDRFEKFYHSTNLQNLRSDFRDLDQHLASRHELLTLLSELPNTLAFDSQDANSSQPSTTSISWINRILNDQRDIVLLSYTNENNQQTYSLLRDPETNNWTFTETSPLNLQLPQNQFENPGTYADAIVSPIFIRPEILQQDPRLFLTLNLSRPIFNQENTLQGGIIMTIDVTDFAAHHQDTIWVRNDGKYLFSKDISDHHSAFDDYAGIESKFQQAEYFLWADTTGQQTIWVPMLQTDQDQPLWVGRRVDPSPISEIQFAISWRVIAIMLLLVIIVLYLSHRFARRAEKLDHDLTDGITSMLEDNQAVKFNWKGPQEVQELGQKLSQLSAIHAQNTERALNHARELEASNRYKSEFLANVSHELRTPLNSILLLSKLIRDDTKTDNASQEKADVINKAGKDLKSLIDNILDLSRIEAGKTTFSIRDIDIRELIEEIAILLRPQFSDKQLNLQVSINNDVPQLLRSDADKIKQVLKNFLSNALKFTDTGDVSIQVSAKSQQILFAVRDNGIGIAKDKHEQIFASFQQADGSINRKHGGTGLGLAISIQLAELLGGSITLDSESGQGATFTLILPTEFNAENVEEELLDIEPVTVEEKPAPSVIKPATEANKYSHQVLIINQDISVLLDLTPRLESQGHTVLAAADLDEALETLTSDPDISCVILDSNPYESNKNLTEIIDQINRPVILLGEASIEQTECHQDIIGLLSDADDEQQLQDLLSEPRNG